ncbi:SDR family NAD(P)-dependent oxidoreductase [Rhizobium lusitanum]|uniref:3-oxoacyl-[acyl-carrier protein] reductase n=1 Tax=Rhizobium lusitanum TaxID=293958 RepID=A0A7X0IUI8_9HYPH|nr:glucose 1-dehydrogenase [Rhizobium lusitanum]MBB6487094.1 3-oxoacyl-[acyl-carrier protein] reductase [Rhizobium lusitanum]
MSTLDGKVALVTGGSRGIGESVVRRFASLGAKVAFTYRAEERKADAICRDLRATGAMVEAFAVDVTDAAAVAELMRNVTTTFGHIDILINNAGTFGVRAIGDIDYAFYAEQFSVNVWGTLQVTQAALALFPESGGRIVNLSSQRAFSPKDRTGVYAASKAAVSTLTQALAIELGPRGITVNAVAPAVTRTDMTAAIPEEKRELLAASTPLRRLGEPDDIAAAIAFLASDEGRWITGRTLLADGGITGA